MSVVQKIALALLAAGVCQQAQAQTIASGIARADPGTTFVAGYSSSASSGPLAGRWVTEFYQNYRGTPRFTARRALDATAGREQVQTITETQCPAIRSVLEALNGLSTPEVRIGNLSGLARPPSSYPRPLTRHTEATHYSIWAEMVQADGYAASSTVSASEGIIGGWGAYADQLLSECWKNASNR